MLDVDVLDESDCGRDVKRAPEQHACKSALEAHATNVCVSIPLHGARADGALHTKETGRARLLFTDKMTIPQQARLVTRYEGSTHVEASPWW